MAQMRNYEPVTVTFRASEWHDLLASLVHTTTSLERTTHALRVNLDPKRDALVLAYVPRYEAMVKALDATTEMLHNCQARTVPGQR